jgi:hypothetical protein
MVPGLASHFPPPLNMGGVASATALTTATIRAAMANDRLLRSYKRRDIRRRRLSKRRRL